MRDVTHLFEHYRITARQLWNSGFWSQADLRDWDTSDRFLTIRQLLFEALVLARVSGSGCGHLGSDDRSRLPFYVVPQGCVPIMIHRPRDGDQNWYWDDPVRQVDGSGAKLLFHDYFDWDLMSYLDFQYYRVRIVSFDSQPHLVGRQALIEHRNARVFVAEEV